jgi:hypothetical protein
MSFEQNIFMSQVRRYRGFHLKESVRSRSLPSELVEQILRVGHFNPSVSVVQILKVDRDFNHSSSSSMVQIPVIFVSSVELTSRKKLLAVVDLMVHVS